MTQSAAAAPAIEPPDPSQELQQAWHTATIETVLGALEATRTGLTADEARRRLDAWGPNELQSLATTSAWRTFAAQFRNALIIILLAATVASGFLGHTLEAVVISVIVFFAVLLGFIQEYRAEQALAALRKMAAPTAHVLRDGVETAVPASAIVIGDVVRLKAGDRVPADGRLTMVANLAVDESALTGESAVVEKAIEPLEEPDLPMGDRRNMAYAGTLVAVGRGEMAVTATGMSTEFGCLPATRPRNSGRCTAISKIGSHVCRVCGRQGSRSITRSPTTGARVCSSPATRRPSRASPRGAPGIASAPITCRTSA